MSFVDHNQKLPVLGLSKDDVLNILNSIFNKNQKILKLIYGEEYVEIETGIIKALLNGSGDVYFIRKIEGEWRIIRTSRWVA